MLRKSREDLSALTKQGHYPPYEKVVLKEGGHSTASARPCQGSSNPGLPVLPASLSRSVFTPQPTSSGRW